MKNNKHIKKFNESEFTNENNSRKDKVISMYISEFDLDDEPSYELVVKTKLGKTFYIEAYSNNDRFEDYGPG